MLAKFGDASLGNKGKWLESGSQKASGVETGTGSGLGFLPAVIGQDRQEEGLVGYQGLDS